MNKQAGVTLVELLIAMVIFMAMASVAVVSYRGYLETAELAAMHQRIDALVIFEENYRVDNGTYLAGSYVPGGVNDFLAMGYSVREDDDDIRLDVDACAGGDIADCFRVTASNASGTTVVWNDGTYQ